MKKNKNKSGSTMIEVMVAFLIVTLMIGMFSKVVTTSVNLYKQSIELMQNTENFNAEYYKITPDTSKITITNVQDSENNNAPLVLQCEGKEIVFKKVKIMQYESSEYKIRRYSIRPVE